MSGYKPTVYEKIVTDFLDNKALDYNNYKAELAERGWKDKRYFDAYLKDMQYIKNVIMEQKDYKDAIAKYIATYFSGKQISSEDVQKKLSAKGWGNAYNANIKEIAEFLEQISDKEKAKNYLNSKIKNDNNIVNISSEDQSTVDKILDKV